MKKFGKSVLCSLPFFLLFFSFHVRLLAVCETPNLLIVLDQSCSMADNNNQKWDDAVTAIKTITNTYNSKLRFGLEAFDTTAQVVYGLDQCVTNGTSCVSKLQTQLNALYPKGSTDLVDAITVAEKHLTAIKNSDSVKTRKNSILFITDGKAACADSQVKLLRKNLSVQVFVIGFGTGVDSTCLDKMATEGGTAKSTTSPKYYQANNSTDLNAAMKAIADASVKEECNNLDDDCDGQTDEGLTQACSSICGTGTQTCSKGVWGTCSAKQPTKEICNDLDDDCDGQIDEDFTQKYQVCVVGVGACQKIGTWICNSAKTSLTCSVQAGTPTTETCNNKDDDCNGKIDDNLVKTCSTSCGTGSETCKNGQWSNCSATQPTEEICDGLDNDCNGKTDEKWPQLGSSCTDGVGSCQNTGKYVCTSNGLNVRCTAQAKAPQQETCNGQDDDCDGLIDEDFPSKGKECTAGSGACENKGQFICSSDGSGVICDAQAKASQQETCNGQDDDCNGLIDDQLVQDCFTGNARQKNVGECKSGKQVCANGTWGKCENEILSAPEVCDGKDNDCNGQVDDQIVKPCQTSCGTGQYTCKEGSWTQCSAPAPQPEICDGIDNDCDGMVDNQAKCPSGTLCSEGSCRTTCLSECGGGEVCTNGLCIGDICKNVNCQQGEKCVGGKCVNLCSFIQCPSGKICSNGNCVENDCYMQGCPTGQICFQGLCIQDLCKNKQCQTGEACKDGVCISSCANVQCAQEEFCEDGKCKENPAKTGNCQGVSCKENETCEKGVCKEEPCAKVSCPKGRLCSKGKCEEDPCLTLNCPEKQLCKAGQCSQDETISSQEKKTGTEKTEETIQENKEPTHDTSKKEEENSASQEKKMGTEKTEETSVADGSVSPNNTEKKPEPPLAGCCQVSERFPSSSLLGLFLFLLFCFTNRKKPKSLA